MEDMQRCTRCGCMRPYSDFRDGSATRKLCVKCRKGNMESKKRARQQTSDENAALSQENAIRFDDISNTVYSEILDQKGLNDDLEGPTNFHADFSVFLDSVSEHIEQELHADCGLQAAKLIVKAVSDGDGYSYVYSTSHTNAETKSATYSYRCNSRDDLAKRSKKVEDRSKRRGTEPYIERFPCGGLVSVKVCQESELVFVRICHELLHPRPEKVSIPAEVKNYIAANVTRSVPEIYQEIKDKHLQGYEYITMKQVYYWWTLTARHQYQRSDNELLSAKSYLIEQQQEILFSNEHGFAFATKFLDALPDSAMSELMVDATYNTNRQKYELYGALAIVDGTGFPVSYLLLASGKNRPVSRTITEWFGRLKEKRFSRIQTIYTDKDFAQIHAAKETWPHINVQLCLWHVKRAIEQKLSSQAGQRSNYNPQDAHDLCSVVDKSWQPIIFHTTNTASKTKRTSRQICDKHTRLEIKAMVDLHFNRHPLIPSSDGSFLDGEKIWMLCVTEMYQYCRQRDLVYAWAYLWKEWYTPAQWSLWARSTSNEISILRTTMVIESHWKTIKRDHLYRFNRPRLDLLCFVLVKKVILFDIQ